MQSKTFNLDERLIQFAARIIDVAEALPRTIAGAHLSGQLVRSGTAPALHYGEAQGAESRNDFIHKMKIALKELRETFNCLRIIRKKEWYNDNELSALLSENDQVIAIFVRSIETAQRNNVITNKNNPVKGTNNINNENR